MSSSRSILKRAFLGAATSLRKSSTLRAYSAEASAATSAGRLVSPTSVTPCLITVLPGSVSGQLPPCGAARSTITEPGFIALHHLLGDQHRRRAAGDQRGGDDDVGLRHALGHFDLLPVQPAGGMGRA